MKRHLLAILDILEELRFVAVEGRGGKGLAQKLARLRADVLQGTRSKSTPKGQS